MFQEKGKIVMSGRTVRRKLDCHFKVRQCFFIFMKPFICFSALNMSCSVIRINLEKFIVELFGTFEQRRSNLNIFFVCYKSRICNFCQHCADGTICKSEIRLGLFAFGICHVFLLQGILFGLIGFDCSLISIDFCRNGLTCSLFGLAGVPNTNDHANKRC